MISGGEGFIVNSMVYIKYIVFQYLTCLQINTTNLINTLSIFVVGEKICILRLHHYH